MNAVMNTDPILTAALDAADAGMAVVWQQGKRAFARGWNKGPALTADELQQTYRSGLNVAFRAGPTSRIAGDAVVVLDVDIRSDEESDKSEARAAYAGLVGQMKPTVRTGGGGAHLYLRIPDNLLPTQPATVLRQSERRLPSDDPGKPGKPAWTIELLAAEHAVTMPPSIHPSGKPYRWDAGLANIQRAPESLLAALLPAPRKEPQTRAAPEPLRRPVPPAQPYPLAELGDVLAPAAQSLRRVIQAPDAVCGASVLAAASLAVQGLANIERERGAAYPLSLWMLTVAESGERKSAVDDEAMRAARDYEKELCKAYSEQEAEHAARLKEWEARRKAAEGKANKADGKGLAEALLSIGTAPLKPLLPITIVADFTAEGLSKLLAAGMPSVGAFTAEAALVFGGHGMTKETVMRTAATLCKLWDSGTLDRVRALDGATKLYGRRLALHLLAQPVIAERALSDAVLTGQGFLPRCLLAWPESTAGTRPYKEEALRDDHALQRLAVRLGDLHRLPLPLAEGERQELEPRSLRLTPEAKRAWIKLHDAIETAMASGEQFATVKPWASKTPEQVLRIAGVLALVDDANAQSVEVATLERAAELALWHLNEAARLAGTAELAPEVRNAEALLNWCHATGRTLLYSTAAMHRGPACIRDQKSFRQAVAVLECAGWACPIEDGAEVDGKRRRHVWRIEGGE